MTRPKAGWYVATAVAGVVAGHALAYSVAVPSDERSAVMDAAGHGYWTSAVAIATFAFAAAIAAIFGQRLRRDTAVAHSVTGTAARLAVLQLVLFSILEVVERMAAGDSLSTLASHHLLLIGLGAQVVVAFAVAAIAAGLDRAAAALAEWLLERPLVPVPLRVVSVDASVRRADAHSFARTSRGPP